MKLLKLYVLLLTLVLCGSALPSLSLAQGQVVVIATIDSEITAGTVPYMERALKKAKVEGAELFFLEINTPGGLLKATESISRLLIESDIPTATFVYRDTGWALSAGAFILLSADTAISHPTAIIGAATPITGGGEDAGEKITNATTEWIASLASRNDLPEEVVRTFVSDATTISGAEAYKAGIIRMLATSTTEALEALGFTEATIIRVSPTVVDNILSFLSLPFLVPLLLSLGALGIFFMFRTGDVESVGLLGIILLFLGLWGAGAITVSTLGVLLLVCGITLVAVEVLFSPGFGFVGVAGIVALLLSMLTFANEPLYPSYFSSTLFYGVLGVWAAVGALMVWMGQLVIKSQLQPVAVGREAWYGKTITLSEPLDPSGRIVLEGDSYVARTSSGESLPEGAVVKIIAIEGNTVLVEVVQQA